MINRRFFFKKSVKTGVAGCFAFLAFVAYATGQVEPKSSVGQVMDKRPNIIFFSDRSALYDLEKDPHEWNNVYYSEENKVIREQLKTELLMHLACTWTGFPVGKG